MHLNESHSSSPISYISNICIVWHSPNHVFLQLANVFLLISYLTSNGIYGILYLRSCLTIASVFFALWGGIILCAADIFIWNLAFVVINALHVICIIWKLHPFIRFPHDVEMVYRNLFQPLRVSRHSFKKIYACTREIQTLKAKDIYAIEGRTHVDKLSLLLTGRVSVIRGGHNLHIIDCHQFVDSPEWFGMGSNDTYQVSIVALEESRLLVWHRDKLKLSICNDAYLQTVLDNILGKDVVKKLLLITDCIGNHNAVANEESKLIVPSHRAIDHVIKRVPLNSNETVASNCFWNLSRITESDAETCV